MGIPGNERADELADMSMQRTNISCHDNPKCKIEPNVYMSIYNKKMETHNKSKWTEMTNNPPVVETKVQKT